VPVSCGSCRVWDVIDKSAPDVDSGSTSKRSCQETPITEADTCRKYVLPKLYGAGWTDDQISEQKTFTDGRIFVFENGCKRKGQKRADYILRYRPNYLVAVVEAKSAYKNAADGMQQAKEYAQTLGAKFAYATNGKSIIEYSFLTGKETEVSMFPPPDELWQLVRQAEGIKDDVVADRILTPGYRVPGKEPRYYQEIAINRVIKAILTGKKRILLTMATGTGKTYVAFQIVWKLWNTRWNRSSEYRKPKVLYLADRNVLVDDPKDKIFAPLGDARWKIQGEAVKGREVYFATYQSIAEDPNRPGLFRQYPRDFFDLIVVDECHRGSAKDENNWRVILDYFQPAVQFGMTATPLRRDNRATYRYFGNPVYTYSLDQGIQDGFLAPYRVRRVITSVDAEGWRPTKDQVDRYGREIPDKLYGTPDFERTIAFRARNEAVATHLTDYMKQNGTWAKTILFCVDQEHADDMRRLLNNMNSGIAKEHPEYVVRIVSDEGDIGRGYLDQFMDIESQVPVIVTTSQLLTTGVDIPLCKNVAIFRVINSMTDFKQIIGRGTRVNSDYGKLFFTILDYTGSATKLFADPEFDGQPASLTEEEAEPDGVWKPVRVLVRPFSEEEGGVIITDDSEGGGSRKLYVDGGTVEITADAVYDLDADGKRIRAISYSEYTGKTVRSMFTSAAELRSKWSEAQQRGAIVDSLEDRGISLEQLLRTSNTPEADPFDLLCNIAFNVPIHTRRERADRIRKEELAFFAKFRPEAREILTEILDKYVEFGTTQLDDANVLKVAPISNFGNVMEISQLFGGPEELRHTIGEMQNLLYT
jgi:type I restriction enzyme R subunit